MIDTIILDIGNVLAYFRWKEYLHEFGFEENVEKDIADKIFCGNVWNEFDAGILSDEQIIEKCCDLLPDCKEEIKKVFDKIENIANEYDYAREWILDLKKSGYKVYLLSNYGKTSFERIGYSFLGDVDGSVISYQVKCVKPEKRIYEELINKYSIISENSVFFDDKQENIDAAIECGINAIIFTNLEQAKTDLLIVSAL